MIVFSSSDSPEDVLSAYDASANAYVQKPTDLEEYEAVVEALDHFWLQTADLPD